MKKMLTVIIAVMLAIGALFSACTGNGGKINDGTGNGEGLQPENRISGKIDGNYSEPDEEEREEIVGRLDGAMPAADDAVSAGGNAAAYGELRLTAGGKTLTIKSDAALALILDLTKINQDGIGVISGAAFNDKMTIKADDGFSTQAWGAIGPVFFGNQYPELADALETEELSMIAGIVSALDNANVSAEFNGYVKESNVYTDAKVTGVPDGIKEAIGGFAEIDFDKLANGIKYSFTEEEVTSFIESLIGAMLGLSGADVSGYGAHISHRPFDTDTESPEAPDFADMSFERICDILELKLYSERADSGIKLKLASTAETKTALKTLIKSFIPEELAETIKNFNVDKFDMEIYLTADNDNVITATAGNIDCTASATVAEQSVSLSFNGALDCSFKVPESIDYPSFDGYQSPTAENAAA